MDEQISDSGGGTDPSGGAPGVRPDQARARHRPATGRGRSLRDPGGETGRLVSWVVIVVVVAVLALSPVVGTIYQELLSRAPAEGDSPAPTLVEEEAPSAMLRLISKYSIGASRLAPGGEEAFVEQIDQMASWSEPSRLRAAIVAAEMLGPEAGLERIESLEESRYDEEYPSTFSEGFADSVALVRTALRDGTDALSESQRAAILDSHGWFGRLLLVHDKPAEDPERAVIYSNAQFVAGMMIVGVVGLGVLGLIGMGLFITAIVLLAKRRVRPSYAPPAPGGGVYLETFALFLGGFVALQLLAGVIMSLDGPDLTRWLVWLILPVVLLPLCRGADRVAWRHALGWHTGKGFFREVGAGVLGYFAGLPIVAVGMLLAVALSLVISALMEWITGDPGAPASHPVIEQIGSGGVLGVVSLYLLAAVWAPVVEESVFRGALYHHVRGRLGVVLSALLVAFIFAAIHPQGIGLIPALMGLAVVFALMREWRGSIVGCVTAHALHNATLVTVLLIALSDAPAYQSLQ